MICTHIKLIHIEYVRLYLLCLVYMLQLFPNILNQFLFSWIMKNAFKFLHIFQANSIYWFDVRIFKSLSFNWLFLLICQILPPKESKIMEEKRIYYCSFCGKSQHEVKKIIAAHVVTICNECVHVCACMLTQNPEFELPIKE